MFSAEHKKIFADLGVQAIYLFGSRAMGKEGPESDYDYAFLMNQPGHSKGDEAYLKLYDVLAGISPRTLDNDVIDIVFLRDAGLELKFHVIRYGKILYDSNVGARYHFEEQTTLLYCDFYPLLKLQDEIILQSL